MIWVRILSLRPFKINGLDLILVPDFLPNIYLLQNLLQFSGGFVPAVFVQFDDGSGGERLGAGQIDLQNSGGRAQGMACDCVLIFGPHFCGFRLNIAFLRVGDAYHALHFCHNYCIYN